MNIQSIKSSNWLKLTPFFIVSAIIAITWITFLIGHYNPVAKHYVALAIFVLNLAVYAFRFKWALIVTGIMLILATLNMASFFYDVSSTWFKIGSLQLPPINGYSFLILTYYFIINFNFLKPIKTNTYE
jgi:hypothetical protein